MTAGARTTGANTALAWGVVASAALTGLVWLAGQRLAGIALLPDQGASWYYWKLPEPTVWTRLSAWLGYAAHQVAFWGLIYYAQTRVRRYTGGLHRVNVVALAVNFGFILLHQAQTQVFYDGLAQDVSIFSSQASVVLLLIVVLLMENRRRGLFAEPPGAHLGGGHVLRPPVPRLSVQLGRRLHVLVSPDGDDERPPYRVLLHVPYPLAGQPLPHPRAHQPLVDPHPGAPGRRARHAGGLHEHRPRRGVADVPLRLPGCVRPHPDARPRPRRRDPLDPGRLLRRGGGGGVRGARHRPGDRGGPHPRHRVPAGGRSGGAAVGGPAPGAAEKPGGDGPAPVGSGGACREDRDYGWVPLFWLGGLAASASPADQAGPGRPRPASRPCAGAARR
ncbi:hypothetical protein ACFSTC_04155 [Nonomuraea ferruginea]